MDIMQSLLLPVWQHEEQRKQSSYHEKLNRITARLFRKIVSPPTALQKKIIGWCGGHPPEVYLTESLNAGPMQNNLSLINQQAAMNTSSLNLPSSQNIQNAVIMNNSHVLVSSMLTPGQVWYSAPNNQITSSAAFPGWPYIFQVLKGIEERCRKADIHRYDEDAVYMLDHRMIDREIPILWLTSFCLSNRQDPEMAIVVLEDNGYVVVEGDNDLP